MPNFLVISYDPDQQQWFYDTVESANPAMAEAYILKLRDYVIAADALTLKDAEQIVKTLKGKATQDTSDPLCECQDCGHVCPESYVGPVKALQERVAAGETMPAGECPECGALSHLIDLDEVYENEEHKT